MKQTSWPRAVPFDPGSGPRADAVPAAWSELVARAAPELPAVLVLAGAQARATRWAAQAAIALARACAQQQRRVILADLSFGAPELHEPLGERNGEGLADVFLFGASLGRVARPVGDGSFYLVPAGAYVGDPAEVLRHPRWTRLIEGCRDAQATLIAYAPAETPGVESLAARVGAVVALVVPADTAIPAAALGGRAPDLVLAPPAALAAVPGPAPAVAAEPSQRRPLPLLDRTQALLERRRRWRAGADTPAVDPVSADPVTADQLLAEPPPLERASAPRSLLRSLAVAAALALLLGGGWVVLRYVRTSERAMAPARDAVAAQPPVVAPSRPLEQLLPFSVRLEVHQDAAIAHERVLWLREEAPELGFFLAPVGVDGVLYLEVLAGPAADRDAALRELDRLRRAAAWPELDSTAVRETPWAYRVAELTTRAQAEARAAELARQAVAGYVVAVPYTDGSTRYRVYAGAYETEAAAEVLGELLRAAGLPDSLTLLTGASNR